jgi:hypothetical protein
MSGELGRLVGLSRAEDRGVNDGRRPWEGGTQVSAPVKEVASLAGLKESQGEGGGSPRSQGGGRNSTSDSKGEASAKRLI